MEPRFDYNTVAPGVRDALVGLEQYLSTTNLDESLLNLVKMRASQINGCVWCLDMHTKDAQVAGEDDQRLLMLPVWREAPMFSDKEKAALDWTESVTLVNKHEFSDEQYAELEKYFSEKDIADLTLAIIAINSWNRLNVPLRNTACTYVPKTK